MQPKRRIIFAYNQWATNEHCPIRQSEEMSVARSHRMASVHGCDKHLEPPVPSLPSFQSAHETEPLRANSHRLQNARGKHSCPYKWRSTCCQSCRLEWQQKVGSTSTYS